jgi:hypothetical protein
LRRSGLPNLGPGQRRLSLAERSKADRQFSAKSGHSAYVNGLGQKGISRKFARRRLPSVGDGFGTSSDETGHVRYLLAKTAEPVSAMADYASSEPFPAFRLALTTTAGSAEISSPRRANAPVFQGSGSVQPAGILVPSRIRRSDQLACHHEGRASMGRD